jgi:hypothetical protein
LSFRGCRINENDTIGASDWHALANQILPQSGYSGLVDSFLAPLPIVLSAIIIPELDQGSR